MVTWPYGRTILLAPKVGFDWTISSTKAFSAVSYPVAATYMRSKPTKNVRPEFICVSSQKVFSSPYGAVDETKT